MQGDCQLADEDGQQARCWAAAVAAAAATAGHVAPVQDEDLCHRRRCRCRWRGCSCWTRRASLG
eukprot:6855306-Alexandrium_andersonii.AAC.1